jgi:hypothetical protein
MSLDQLKQDLRALCAESETLKSATDETLAASIVAAAEALAAHNPTPDPAARPDLFAGRWALLFSSFRLERESDLAKLSFSALPAAKVRVERLFQEIWPDADSAYDNVVELIDPAGKPLSKVMLGRFDAHDSARFDVVFSQVFAAARDGRSQAALASDLGLPADAALNVAIGRTPPLHSTIIYLDTDLRIMKGVYGGVYVLERVALPPARARAMLPA